MNHTLELIDGLQDYRVHNEGRDTDDPMYWWLENPTGMMRYQPKWVCGHWASQEAQDDW